MPEAIGRIVTIHDPVYTASEKRTPLVRCLIQARMTSERFPGKSLAPFQGKPLIWWVVRACMAAVDDASLVTVLTTDQPAERPLVAYLKDIGVSVFCGPAKDVFRRYKEALWFYPCEWFFRVCGDSPLLDPAVLRQAKELLTPDTTVDVFTNVWPERRNPPGQSCELVRTSSFLSVDESELTDIDREHLISFFYRHPDKFSIYRLPASSGSWSQSAYVVDTIEDLRRLEKI